MILIIVMIISSLLLLIIIIETIAIRIGAEGWEEEGET